MGWLSYKDLEYDQNQEKSPLRIKIDVSKATH